VRPFPRPLQGVAAPPRRFACLPESSFQQRPGRAGSLEQHHARRLQHRADAQFAHFFSQKPKGKNADSAAWIVSPPYPRPMAGHSGDCTLVCKTATFQGESAWLELP